MSRKDEKEEPEFAEAVFFFFFFFCIWATLLSYLQIGHPGSLAAVFTVLHGKRKQGSHLYLFIL